MSTTNDVRAAVAKRFPVAHLRRSAEYGATDMFSNGLEYIESQWAQAQLDFDDARAYLYGAIIAANMSGMPTREIARRFGVSRETVRKALETKEVQ